MTELYVNNFRGFRDTFIPIDKVNFLIGENSTGKTSILKLIRVLMDFKFWDLLDTTTLDFDLGYFQELCDSDSFEVGICERINQSEIFKKITLINTEGATTVHDFRVCSKTEDHTENIYMIFEKDNVKYNYSKSKKANLNGHSTSFQDWIGQNPPIDSFTEIKLKKGRVHPLRLRQYSLLDLIFENINISETLKNVTYYKSKNLMMWLAPIRVEPKSIYSNYSVSTQSADGSDTPFLLKLLLEPNDSYNYDRHNVVVNALNIFGQNSGMFDSIKVVSVDSEEFPPPIEIFIDLGKHNIKISNVGYGVSQILPLIIQILFHGEKTLYAIQQPEIHLHPRGQAAFGELIYDTQKSDNKTFIIETHSDYIVDRFRLCVNKDKEETSDEFQVLFFERTKDGNKVTPIKIQSNGKYTDDQPKSFQEFFIKEQLELIKL